MQLPKYKEWLNQQIVGLREKQGQLERDVVAHVGAIQALETALAKLDAPDDHESSQPTLETVDGEPVEIIGVK